MKFFLPRLRAAGLHFLISAVVVAVVVAGAVYLWYPGNLAWAAGLASMVTILAAVDLVIGPALTFVVFQPGKKSLRFDLSVIAGLQIAALVFGVSSIYQARPVYLAFVVDRFETVAAADLEQSQLDEADEPYRTISSSGPRIVGVQLPEDPAELDALTMAEAINGTGPALIPRYYREYETLTEAALKKAKNIADLNAFNAPEKVEKALAALKRKPDQMRYVPLSGRDRDLTVILDAQSGKVVDILDLRPWQS